MPSVAGSPDTGMSARRGARTGLILINHHGYHSKHIMCPPHWSKLRTLCTILATSKLWSLNHALVGYLFNSLILNCASNYSTPDVSIWNLEAPLWYWFWLLLLLWNFPNLQVYFQDFRPQIKSALRGLFPKNYDWTWWDLKYDTPPTMVNLRIRLTNKWNNSQLSQPRTNNHVDSWIQTPLTANGWTNIRVPITRTYPIPNFPSKAITTTAPTRRMG